MQISKLKKVEDMGLMEGKILEMCKEFSELRDKESTMRAQLQAKNRWLRKKLQDKETQLAIMESLSMEVLQYRFPFKSYEIFLKEQ